VLVSYIVMKIAETGQQYTIFVCEVYVHGTHVCDENGGNASTKFTDVLRDGR
jgi:hypothetical protein